jgi:hypothetical protein
MFRNGSSAFLPTHRLLRAEVHKAQHLVASGICSRLPRHYASESAARFLHLYSEPLYLVSSCMRRGGIPGDSGPIGPGLCRILDMSFREDLFSAVR